MHCVVQEGDEKGINLLAFVNGKTRCESIQTLNFLRLSNEIHSS
jgi:hypothetical protein